MLFRVQKNERRRVVWAILLSDARGIRRVIKHTAGPLDCLAFIPLVGVYTHWGCSSKLPGFFKLAEFIPPCGVLKQWKILNRHLFLCSANANGKKITNMALKGQTMPIPSGSDIYYHLLQLYMKWREGDSITPCHSTYQKNNIEKALPNRRGCRTLNTIKECYHS